MHQLPIKKALPEQEKRFALKTEKAKLLNLIYDKGDYYIHEPSGDKRVTRDPDLIIEKHCWFVLKFLDDQRLAVKQNDVVRFGRVTFKITEMAITQEEIARAHKAIESLHNGVFKVGNANNYNNNFNENQSVDQNVHVMVD